MMRSLWSYLIATVTLPLNWFALALPALIVPFFVSLSSADAEINGIKISATPSSLLPSLVYVVLLSSCWMSGVNCNNFDKEIRRVVLNKGIIFEEIVPLIVHGLFGIANVAIAYFELLIIGNIDLFYNPKIIVVVFVEALAVSVLGCAVGRAFNNGVLSTISILLYSILLQPAVERLIPFVVQRGVAARIVDLNSGEELWASVFLDVVFFLSIALLFLLFTRVLRPWMGAKNA
ncbi:hypothetical protein [Propionimicrobium lymphophilum]|uniref:hypothetical protein n=1 Tax=Propionimicrobium lymphophilum TaxID=33012 RepID=UPI00288B635D|nr:hypothetical protein [Propionimicrobium lymphophilum]